jgi:hypothetical protein
MQSITSQHITVHRPQPMTVQPESAQQFLSVIPPMTQLNTPYPSTAYLTGFLRSRGFDAVQEDLALKLVLKLFCPEGLTAIRETVVAAHRTQSASVTAFLDNFDRCRATIEPTIKFLQCSDSTLAHRIVTHVSSGGTAVGNA